MQLAAVDLGSNSFRLQMGRAHGRHIELQGYWKETVRLAAGVDADQRISRRAIDTACECLARMNERLRGLPLAQVRAVGTQTLRDAPNSDEFLIEAQHALGYPIEVISGREEARLIFEGCSHELPLTDQPRLVVDIGGASTEMIVGTGFRAASAESFKVGCVNSSLRFFKDGRIDRAALKRAQVAAAAEIVEAVSLFGAANWSEAWGSSGTVGAVSEILRAEGWSDGTITADGLQRVRGAVLEAGEVGRIRLAGMKPDRQSVIAGGLAVLSAVFDTLGVTSMKPARGGLRVGVLYDLLGRLPERPLQELLIAAAGPLAVGKATLEAQGHRRTDVTGRRRHRGRQGRERRNDDHPGRRGPCGQEESRGAHAARRGGSGVVPDGEGQRRRRGRFSDGQEVSVAEREDLPCPRVGRLAPFRDRLGVAEHVDGLLQADELRGVHEGGSRHDERHVALRHDLPAQARLDEAAGRTVRDDEAGALSRLDEERDGPSAEADDGALREGARDRDARPHRAHPRLELQGRLLSGGGNRDREDDREGEDLHATHISPTLEAPQQT